MRKRNIGRSLQMKVRRYLEYMHQEEIDGFQRGETLVHKNLSNQLKNDIFFESFGKILSNCKILKENFSPEFLQNLCLNIKEISFPPEEKICEVI